MIDTSKLPLGDQVRLQRVFEKKTQTQLAAELGMGQQYLSLYETGRLTPNVEHYKKLTDYVKP